MEHVEKNANMALVRASSNDPTLKHVFIENTTPETADYYAKVLSSLADNISNTVTSIETFVVAGVPLTSGTWKSLAQFVQNRKSLTRFEVTGASADPSELTHDFSCIISDSSIPYTYIGPDGILIKF